MIQMLIYSSPLAVAISSLNINACLKFKSIKAFPPFEGFYYAERLQSNKERLKSNKERLK